MMDSSLEYLSQEYFDENGDPFTSQLPGMRNPWLFFAIGINLILFCKYFGPKLMENKKPMDLRPGMIILNGLAFGAYTAGVFLGVYITDYFRHCMDCRSYEPNTEDLKQISMKYLGYVLIYTKIFDFIRPVLSVLAKKNDRVTNMQLMHLQISLMIAWAGVKLNPGGIFVFVALNDTLYQLLVYGYLIMTASSPEMQPSPSFRNVLMYFREVSVAITFLHQFYFLVQGNCTGSYALQVFSTIYTALLTLLYPIDFHNRTRAKVGDLSSKKKDLAFGVDANKNAIAD